MANKQYQITMVMNAKQLETDIQLLGKLMDEYVKKAADMKLETQEDEEAFNDLQKQIAELQKVINEEKKQLKGFDNIMQNLAGSTLNELRRAFRQVKSDMGKATEESGKMPKLREAYEKITRQIQKMGAEWVNVSDVLKRVGTASEKELRQALSQTKELHAATARNTTEYQEQIKTIDKLESELGKMNSKVDTDKVMGNLGGSTVGEIKMAIQEMERAREKTIGGGAEWTKLGDQIREAKEHLEKFSETEKAMSLKEARSLGDGIGINDASIAQLKEAIKLLEKAREAMKPSDTDGLKTLDDQLEKVQNRLDKLNEKPAFDYNQVLGNLSSASTDSIKKAISAMEELRNKVELGGNEWSVLNEKINSAKKYLDSFSESMSEGRAKKIGAGIDIDKRTVGELEQAVAVLEKMKKALKPGDMAGLKDLEEKIDRINEKLGKKVSPKAIIGNIDTATTNQIKSAISALEKLRGEVGVGSDKWNEYTEDLKKAKKYLDEITNEPFDYSKVMNDLPNASTESIKQAITAMEQLRNKAKLGSDEWNDLGSEIKKAKQYLDNFSESMSEDQARDIGDGIGIDDKTIEELEQAIRLLEKMKKHLKPGDEDGLKKIDEQIANINKQLGKTEDGFKGVDHVLNNLSTASLDDLKKAAALLEERMNKAARDTEEFSNSQKQLAQVREQIEKVNNSFKKQESVIKQVMKRLTAYVLIYSGFNVVKDKLFEVVRMNLTLSDSLADIRKTTGLVNSEVELLADNLLKLDTRTTAEDLNKLAYEAGRMGVGRFGVEGVEGFVKAANKIGVALSEDLGDDAIAQIYKLADVMRIIPQLGVEGSLLSVGSAINELVQTGTSSGAFIVDFTSRMAGIAAQANLTTAEVAGFGSALDEMGQEVEVSATSMNKFVMQMFTHYKLVAKAADMSEDTLKTMLENGETADAIVAVMEGLSKKGGLSMLAPLFKDLGSDGARLSQTLAAMSSNVDKLKTSLNTARTAFNEMRSVTDEYNIKNKTTEALIERIKNSWTEFFVNSKNKGAIHELVEDLKRFSDALLENKGFIALLEGALKLLGLALEALLHFGPALIAFFATMKTMEVVRKIWMSTIVTVKSLKGAFDYMRYSTAALTGAQNSLSASTKRSAASFKGLMKSMKGNIYVMVASAVVSLISYIVTLNDEMDKTTSALKAVDDKYSEYIKEVTKAKVETDGLFKVLNSENSSKMERAAAIKTINEQYGKYLPNLITEKSTLEDIAIAQKAVNEEMSKARAYRMKQNALIEALDPVYEEQAAGMEKYTESYNKQLDAEKYNKGYVSTTKGFAPDVFEAAVRSEVEKGNLDEKEIFKNVNKKAAEASGVEWDENKRYLGAWNDMKDFIRGVIHESEVNTRANAKFDPHIKDYNPYTSTNGKIVDSGGDTDAQKRDKAKKEYESLIYKIKEFFAIQEAAVKDSYIKGQISEQTKSGYLTGLDVKKNETLMHANNSVAGRENDWKGAKAGLSDVTFDTSEDTLKLINSIKKVNVKDLNATLKKFGPEFLDQIGNKAAENLVKVKDAGVKVRDEITKILLEDNYLGQNQQKFQAQFEQLKLMNVDYLKVREESEDKSERAISHNIQQIWTNTFHYLRENYDGLFDIDMMTAEGQAAFANFLKPLSSEFPQLLKLSEEEMRVLYNEMTKLYEADEDAHRKAVNREDKRLHFGFSKKDSTKANLSAQDKQESDMRWTGVMNQVGLSSEGFAADQEVELYRLKLEAAAEYYEYVMTHAEEKENMDKAQRELDEATMAMTEKLVAQVGTHLSYLQEYGDAIADFGTDFGAAIFGSLEDRQKTIENLGKSFAETTKKIIMDWVKQRMMHKLHTKLMKKEEHGFQKDMTKDQKEGSEKRTAIEDVGQKAMGDISKAGAEKIGQISKKKSAEAVQDEAAETQAKTSMGVAQGAAKTIGELGWWGIPLIAVIEALLNGLLSMAMSKVSSLFGGGGADKAAPAIKTKIVSGMLTYDSGNVQEVAKYMGDDGIVYTVSKKMDNLETGLVTAPTATHVNGQPSLVGEQGPELVVGRETTAALMMNNPGLLRYLINFDKGYSGRGYRAYDKGNLNEISVEGGGDQDTMMLSVLKELSENNAALTAELKRGIRANINKFGKGGIVDEVVDGVLFQADNGNDPKIKKFFTRRK